LLETRSFNYLNYCVQWLQYNFKIYVMGKGDKKSKRGKIVLGSYGVRRRRKETKKLMPAKAVEVEKSEVEAEIKEAKPKRKVKTTPAE